MSKKRKRAQDPDTPQEDTPLHQNESSPAIANQEEGSLTVSEENLPHIRKKVHHAFVLAARAFKKSRDFEIKKIIRRLKLTR
jgi:hypothetical protein